MFDLHGDSGLEYLGLFLAALGACHAAQLILRLGIWCVEQATEHAATIPNEIDRIVKALRELRGQMAAARASLSPLWDELAAWWRFFRGT